jgi:UDP-glucose 4-epimerase
MKIIVFGGSGFVGSHVTDALTAAGHAVTIFDIKPSRYRQPGQNFIKGDIMDAVAVKKAVESHEVLYNFAGLADIDDACARPVDTVRLNVEGCVNQLEAAREAGIRRFVFASSIYVYSESGGFYRCSKQACELYIEEYQRRFGLDYTILRFGTIYGRRADERNTVYRCLRQALKERRIVVTGLPEAIREYIHVEDAARASEQILGNEFRNQNVILTGQHTMRFRDLLQMIREIVGADVKIEINPPGKIHDAVGHYSFTPYTFHPKIAKKLVNNYYLDMGQGLLDCLEEIDQSNDALNSAKVLTHGQ